MPVSCGPRFSGVKSLTPGTQGMSQGSLESSIPSHMEHSVKVRLMNPAFVAPAKLLGLFQAEPARGGFSWPANLVLPLYPTLPQPRSRALLSSNNPSGTLAVSGLSPWADKAKWRLGWALETSGARQKAMAFIPLGGGSQHGWPSREGTGPELSLPMQTRAVGA